MKEIPILFSTPMVQAILAGRKTMTRRVAAVPVGDHFGTDIMDWHLSEHPHQTDEKWYYSVQTDVDAYSIYEIKCKYGNPGDLLWVREEHYRYGKWTKDGKTKAGEQKWKFVATSDKVLYADNPPATNWKSRQAHNKASNWEEMGTWYKRLARFMPKSAARIWLQVTDIRVERLWDIIEADAIGEGVEAKETKLGPSYLDYETGYCNGLFDAKRSFQSLWQSINGTESWITNPWVWVISFKVLATTGKPDLKTITTKQL